MRTVLIQTILLTATLLSANSNATRPEKVTDKNGYQLYFMDLVNPLAPVEKVNGSYVRIKNFTGYTLDYKGGPYISQDELKKHCFVAPLVWQDLATSSSFFGAIEDFNELYNRANVFGSVDPYSTGAYLYTDVLDFALNAAPSSDGNFPTDLYGQGGTYAILNGSVDFNKLKSTGKCSGKELKDYYVGSIIYGMSLVVISKIQFADPTALTKWSATFKETPITSVFLNSKAAPATVTANLKKYGARISTHILQLGGTPSDTKAAALAVGCSISDIAKCRKVVETVFASFTAQYPTQPDTNTLNYLEPLGGYPSNVPPPALLAH